MELPRSSSSISLLYSHRDVMRNSIHKTRFILTNRQRSNLKNQFLAVLKFLCANQVNCEHQKQYQTASPAFVLDITTIVSSSTFTVKKTLNSKLYQKQIKIIIEAIMVRLTNEFLQIFSPYPFSCDVRLDNQTTSVFNV